MWRFSALALLLLSCYHIGDISLGNQSEGTSAPGNMTNDSSLQGKDDGSETGGSSDEGVPTGIIVVCTVVVIVVCLLAGVVAFFLCRRRIGKPRYGILRRTLDDKANTMSLAKLKKKSAEVIGSTKAAETVISMIADETIEKNDIDCGKITELDAPVRYEFIKLRTETAVVLHKGSRRSSSEEIKLHMSKMYDYYGQPAIICQSPLPEQFADQWRAIWQEKVGLIVWIGSLEEKGEKKIEPYIPLKERQKMNLDNFVIQTVAVVKSTHEYDQYLVRVYKTRDKKRRHTHSRNLIFVHAHFWPDHSAPMVPAKLADFVERLHDHHTEAALKGLAAILIHCSAGVQRSPALLAAYIGRQIWEAEHEVNLLGIMRYIRRNRYKAFELGNSALQVQIVYGIMQILATRIELQSKTGVKRQRKHQRDVFQECMRSYAEKTSGSGSDSSTKSHSSSK